jgi:type II secretory pathway pseudopilin PulG
MEQPSPNRPRSSEEGYMLAVVIFMLAILILSLSIAVPRVRESIQRDREEETMQRGNQYIRAIQLYYRKFNAYPPNVDALVKTNNIRFLRKKYVDPTTGKDEWKAIMYCQNKTPQAMGFFGQPLAGTGCGAAAGTGPGGGNGINGSTAGLGGSSPSGGIFSNNPGTDPAAGTAGTQAGTQAGAGGGDASAGPASGSGTITGTSGTGTAGGSSTGSVFGSSNPAGSGQTFGGGGIIGFSPQSPKQSLLVYKKKNHYSDWEFLYSPLMDRQTMAGGNTGMVGQPASGTTTPIGGPGTMSPGAPSPPITPTTPQQ